MTEKKQLPIKPGEILLEEFLKPLGITQDNLAKEINLPVEHINNIIIGQEAIKAGTALRLSRYFSLSERFWMNLQTRYDLETEKDRLQDKLDKEVHVYHQ